MLMLALNFLIAIIKCSSIESITETAEITHNQMQQVIKFYLKNAQAYQLISAQIEKEYKKDVLPKILGIFTHEKIENFLSKDLQASIKAWTPGTHNVTEFTYEEYIKHLRLLVETDFCDIRTFHLFRLENIIKFLDTINIKMGNYILHQADVECVKNFLIELTKKEKELRLLVSLLEKLKIIISKIEHLLKMSDHSKSDKNFQLQIKMNPLAIGLSLRSIAYITLNRVSCYATNDDLNQMKNTQLLTTRNTTFSSYLPLLYYQSEYQLVNFIINNQSVLSKQEKEDLDKLYSKIQLSNEDFIVIDKILGQLFLNSLNILSIEPDVHPNGNKNEPIQQQTFNFKKENDRFQELLLESYKVLKKNGSLSTSEDSSYCIDYRPESIPSSE